MATIIIVCCGVECTQCTHQTTIHIHTLMDKSNLFQPHVTHRLDFMFTFFDSVHALHAVGLFFSAFFYSFAMYKSLRACKYRKRRRLLSPVP